MHPRHLFLVVAITLSSLTACSGGGGSSAPANYAGGGSGGNGTSAQGGNAGGGTATASPTPSSAPPLSNSGGQPAVPPAGQIYLGAYVREGNGGSDATNIALLESQVGRHMALSLHYAGWTTPFGGADEVTDVQEGRIPVISWQCGAPNAAVASGSQDANIGAHADELRAFGKPVFLRYDWEFNLTEGTNGRTACVDSAGLLGFFSPADFIAAWNHIHAIFAAHGANNVAFLWNPSGGRPNPPAAYYPGSASVDWVGIDEYDRTDITFAQTYDLYPQVVGYNKPILITETAANPEYQTTFLAAAGPSLQSLFPAVKGLIYFDAPGNFSWTLTPAGLGSFTAMGHLPYFSAK
ncbi:MAG: hypothetical protein IAI50_04350 [Candidatus Eremiobacteraeota bacterium]|nr:hypothetical protein [Candidatus Eremiobacteraeota bacterium]